MSGAVAARPEEREGWEGVVIRGDARGLGAGSHPGNYHIPNQCSHLSD